MKIFVTGVAGFIGFSISLQLLKKKYTVYAIDNLDNYYSPRLKKERLKILQKYKNFEFKKIDISKRKQLNSYLKDKKFDIIYHFAAQAGVRYSIINPKKYIQSNLKGFRNLLFSTQNKDFKYIFYASSSSVYGDNKKFPLKETFKLRPKNLYARTKIQNEKDAKKFKSTYKKNIVGLRFFTVYGEWGRPDMMILKLLSYLKKDKIFELNNSGDHYRDFTYIKDVIKILIKISNIKFFKYDVYNICSSRPIFIKNVINEFKNFTNFKLIKNVKKNKLDVYKTFGDNSRLRKLVNVNRYTVFKKGLFNTIKWYKNTGYKYF